MLIWTTIMIGMFILVLVVYFLNTSAFFKPVPESRQYGQILFILAVIFASAILILKRSVLLPEKVVSRLPKTIDKTDQSSVLLARIGANYLIVWSIAEAILITGFINYILTTDFNNFLIFAIVAVYSLLINLPRENTLHRAIALMEERE